MKRWLIRIVVMVAIVEIVYLAVVNTVLNLPSTQTYVNQLHPERYVYTWKSAWSWYPTRIDVTELSANGQTWSQQWQVSAPAVRGTLAIIPLLWKTVHIYDLDTAEVDVRFRPRPSPERKDAAARKFYPPIEGRDPDAAAEAPPAQTPGWKFIVDIAEISGQNDVWVWQTKATLVGGGRATIMHQSHAGPLEISNGDLDATFKSLTFDGDQVSDSGSIEGTFSFATFEPQKNRGIKILNFLTADADIDLPIDGLDFLNSYLTRVTGMTLGGKGGLKGHIAFDKGDLASGTDLNIAADGLTVANTRYSIDGSGTVDLTVNATDPKTLGAEFQFATLSAFYGSDRAELFAGEKLKVTVERPTRVLPGGDDEKGPSLVAIDVPLMTVSDLKTYQNFVPDNWNSEIVGGTGSLEGKARLSTSDLDVDLKLRSENAEIEFKDDSFETNLELDLMAKGNAPGDTASIDFSGTSLTLDDSRIKNSKGDDSAPWQARLAISKGQAEIQLPKPTDKAEGFWRLAHDKNIKGLLSTLDGDLEADLTISDVNWANLLFANSYSVAFHNAAKIKAGLVVSSGWLGTGSTLKMQPQSFRLEVLDYIAEGSGGFDVTVETGGEEPDLRLDAHLAEASLRLQDEKDAVVDQMTLTLSASAKDVSVKDGGKVTEVDLNIPSAKVTDMAAYNAYLPGGSPIRIRSGTADLTAKVNMQEKTAGGAITLKTSRIEADLDGTRISGVVDVDVNIRGGSAQAKTFDIGGSKLTLTDVRVSGAGGNNWSARADLGSGRVVWKKPLSLDASTSIRMTDTLPLVAMFEADRKTHKWLDRILNLKDVRGTATFKVEPNEFVVPYALAKSDTVELGVKGLIREGNRQGMFYAKYGKLAGILELENKKKHFSIISPTKKFEAYKPGGRLPGLHESSSSGRSETKKSPFSIFKRK